MAVAHAGTISLDALNNYGDIIGGTNNTAAITNSAITASSSYSDLNTQLTQTNTWYVSQGYNNDIGGYSPTSDGITLVAGGPPNAGTSAVGGIRFTLDHSTLATCTGDLTFSFDLKLTSAGNNNKNHAFSFSLMNGSEALQSLVYNSKTGDNLLSDSSSVNVQMTFTATQVAAMLSTGTDINLIFLASTDSVSGSNKGVIMSNFQLSGADLTVPEPATASLGLLGLAALLMRRRRA